MTDDADVWTGGGIEGVFVDICCCVARWIADSEYCEWLLGRFVTGPIPAWRNWWDGRIGVLWFIDWCWCDWKRFSVRGEVCLPKFICWGEAERAPSCEDVWFKWGKWSRWPWFYNKEEEVEINK